MLTRLVIRNFKKLKNVEIELAKNVVLIGPNNSGKSTALQALALWDLALNEWISKRGGKISPEKRPGVAINRKDIIDLPVPDAKLLWNDLHVRSSSEKQTKNIRIDVQVDGVLNNAQWSCGFEFDYSTEEALICRPLRLPGYEEMRVKDARFTEVPEVLIPKDDGTQAIHMAHLPPMSGLAAIEPKLERGRINVLMGEGQTAQVLRNICYQVASSSDGHNWVQLRESIKELFLVTLHDPEYIPQRGEIIMQYDEPSGVTLDLSCSGRGLQQTLLLLAHLYANPRSVLLLDEPDAHLEILRQRQIYSLLSEVADAQGSQVIAASHSEVILNEAAGKGRVIAFVGQPHALNDRGSQVLKALADIGYEQYYQAEQKGWVIYLEDSTDLAILQAFAAKLKHPAKTYLLRPFVRYVGNLPQKAREHFRGIIEAKPDMVGIAIFDRLDKVLHGDPILVEAMWERREIENYFCCEAVLMSYAAADQPDDLFGQAERECRIKAMNEAIAEVSTASRTLGKPDPWSVDIKATGNFLDPLFRRFSEKLNLPLVIRKNEYYKLVHFMSEGNIDPDIIKKLDTIGLVAQKAKPVNGGME
jgi:predicted ATPase